MPPLVRASTHGKLCIIGVHRTEGHQARVQTLCRVQSADDCAKMDMGKEGQGSWNGAAAKRKVQAKTATGSTIDVTV